jgi:hypothetical protein
MEGFKVAEKVLKALKHEIQGEIELVLYNRTWKCFYNTLTLIPVVLGGGIPSTAIPVNPTQTHVPLPGQRLLWPFESPQNLHGELQIGSRGSKRCLSVY